MSSLDLSSVGVVGCSLQKQTVKLTHGEVFYCSTFVKSSAFVFEIGGYRIRWDLLDQRKVQFSFT